MGAGGGALRHHRSWVGKCPRTAGLGETSGGRKDIEISFHSTDSRTVSGMHEQVTAPLPGVTNLIAELCPVCSVVCKVGHPQINTSEENGENCRQSGTRECKASLAKIRNVWCWSFRGQ